MTIKKLKEANEKFQQSATQLSELFPLYFLTNIVSFGIRNAGKIQSFLEKLASPCPDGQFNKTIEDMEYCMDEVIFILDQLEIANRRQNIEQVNDFLKEGYLLLSTYSRWIDEMIKRRMLVEE